MFENETAVTEASDNLQALEKDERSLCKTSVAENSAPDRGQLSNLIREKSASEPGLDEKDLIIIERLVCALTDGKDGVRGIDILKWIESEPVEVINAISRIQRLKASGIIEAAKSSGEELSPIDLLRSSLRITDNFFRKMFGAQEPVETEKELLPYKDNEDYLADQFERIRLLDNAGGRSAFKIPRRRPLRPSNSETGKENLPELEDMIAGRLALSGKDFPFEKFKREKQLTRDEEIIVLALLRHSVLEDGQRDADELIDLIASTPFEILKARQTLGIEGRLYKEKILGHIRMLYPRYGLDRLILHGNIRSMLLCEKKRAKKGRDKDDFFEIVKPGVTLDDVIMHPRTLEQVSIAVEQMAGGFARRLAQWGFKGKHPQGSSKKTKQLGVTMLFYGPPGTGKTLTAHAIAGMLKKEVFVLDCSKILNKWVGESEKKTRLVFEKFRELSGKKKNPPVLLLNEADQFLHRRIEATRGVDHMYNQMQNIFLEQLESFEGILIATTNLVGSMDAAFSRRFCQKIEFRRPGREERLRLWKKLLPDKAPLANDVDLHALASRYDLSGGQISIILLNAATKAAMRGDGICQRDLVSASEEEVKGNFDEMAGHRLGFHND